MSILLEALRKSEKHQHSPGAPNIHTDDQPGPASDSIKTGPLALLLVVARLAQCFQENGHLSSSSALASAGPSCAYSCIGH